MKRLISVIIAIIISIMAMAQVPYFGKAPGNKKLYGYTSLKVRPGINSIESYNTFQFGLSDYTAVGLDYYTGPGSAYMGYMIRIGYKVSQWFSIGSTLTPSFDLNDNYKFSYITGGLFMNGGLTKDARLFWCTNTWFGLNGDKTFSIRQFTYLGYEFSLMKGTAITPMVGLDHSWKFDERIDIATGIYYTHGIWNFYVWGNDFCKPNPRVVIGVDFKF